ncbi:HK97 gp10 family phage protein [Holzapfeliella sp. He02]|uniref:HK97 gp10 family phage protein n=1 Tax=Holzapfeliella saturejae TaxID=3082953 RepID=A0ABU8SHZ7_9LACO
MNLEEQISQILNGFSNEVKTTISTATEESADKAVDYLKNNSPKHTGKYAKSWTKTKRGKAIIVNNKKFYTLTHLLEYGHQKRSGGRTKALPHIAKAEKLANDNFEREIRNIGT